MPNQLVFGLGDERYKVVNKVKLTTKRLFNASDTQANLIEMPISKKECWFLVERNLLRGYL